MVNHNLYNPSEASRFLTDRGYPVSKSTLAKQRCIGGGPDFRKFGSRVLYSENALLDWANSKLSDPMANTASLGGDA